MRGGVDLVLTETADLGRIALANPDAPGEGSGFTVLALGKHGAGELNYSSDIDLVVFFDPHTSALPKARSLRPSTRGSRSSSRGFSRSARPTATSIASIIGSAPIRARLTAVSLASAYTYYETVGQNWERAALIKARPWRATWAWASAF